MSGDFAEAPTTDLQDKLVAARHYAAVATAFTLPFSTSGQAIAVSIFAVLALLTLDRERFVATMRTPAAYLPAVLFALVLIGVTWSSMQPSWAGAFKWVGPYVKLLLIPLVMSTAFTPKQALQIGYGFLASCVVVLALSYSALLWPSGPWGWFKSTGIPFKDNAVQSECFGLCAFGLAMGALRAWSQDDRRRVMAFAIPALLFFANIFLIYVSKTGMLVAATLLGLFLIQMNGWRRAAMVGIPALVLIGVALWQSAPAHQRLSEISIDVHANNGTAESISTASRIDFWTKAVEFVKQAPLFGHGTGSIKPLYQSLEATRPSPYGEAVPDPHNQFLHIVLQVGLVGGVILLAMWAVHVRMFLGRDIASAIGLAVVVQNFLGSLFNSHISQVTQGMLYCLAVGLLGSIVRHARKPGD
jgi:O-antigen ligase